MDQPYLIQAQEPLFPKVLWNRPVSLAAAGRLLLVGGSRNDFQTIQAIYQFALASGAGACLTVLPDSLRTLLQGFSDTFFVPSSPSGSIGKAALAEILHVSNDYDAFSVGANISNNSETAIVIDRLITETDRPAILYLEALDSLSIRPSVATGRTDCLIIASMPELFKLAGLLGVALNIQPERGILGRVELVQSVASAMAASLVCTGRELIVVSGGQTSVTPDISVHIQPAIYAAMSVFWTQGQTFEQLTTAAFVLRSVSDQVAGEDPLTSQRIATTLTAALHNL